MATCDDTLEERRDRALFYFGFASGGGRRSEIAAADALPDGGYLYRFGHSKTQQNGATATSTSDSRWSVGRRRPGRLVGVCGHYRRPRLPPPLAEPSGWESRQRPSPTSSDAGPSPRDHLAITANPAFVRGCHRRRTAGAPYPPRWQ
jgi:hypothetical protein